LVISVLRTTTRVRVDAVVALQRIEHLSTADRQLRREGSIGSQLDHPVKEAALRGGKRNRPLLLDDVPTCRDAFRRTPFVRELPEHHVHPSWLPHVGKTGTEVGRRIE